MTKPDRDPRSSRETDLDDDLLGDYDHDLVVDTRRRLDRLEAHLTSQRPHAETTLEKGERILAKAQEVAAHLTTPAGILEQAQRVMSNPNDIGIVSGFLAIGTDEAVAKAASLVAEQTHRNDAAHAAAAVIDGVTADLRRGDGLGELRGAFETLRQDYTGLLDRINRLEQAPSAAPVMPVVAKAEGRTSRPVQASAASLLSRGQGVIDSPNTIGILSGLIEAGNLSEA